jgi:hypothetical protein
MLLIRAARLVIRRCFQFVFCRLSNAAAEFKIMMRRPARFAVLP